MNRFDCFANFYLDLEDLFTGITESVLNADCSSNWWFLILSSELKTKTFNATESKNRNKTDLNVWKR